LYDGKLAGIGAYALDCSVNRIAETPPEAGSLILVPVLRSDQLGGCCLAEDNRMV
jgi:hypothetical protein